MSSNVYKSQSKNIEPIKSIEPVEPLDEFDIEFHKRLVRQTHFDSINVLVSTVDIYFAFETMVFDKSSGDMKDIQYFPVYRSETREEAEKDHDKAIQDVTEYFIKNLKGEK